MKGCALGAKQRLTVEDNLSCEAKGRGNGEKHEKAAVLVLRQRDGVRPCALHYTTGQQALRLMSVHNNTTASSPLFHTAVVCEKPRDRAHQNSLQSHEASARAAKFRVHTRYSSPELYTISVSFQMPLACSAVTSLPIHSSALSIMAWYVLLATIGAGLGTGLYGVCTAWKGRYLRERSTPSGGEGTVGQGGVMAWVCRPFASMHRQVG